MKRVVKYILLLTLSFVFPQAKCANHVANAQKSFINAKALPNNFADIVEPLLRSVVNISITSENKNRDNVELNNKTPFGELLKEFLGRMPRQMPKKSHSLGSGFIVQQKGDYAYIVTSNHVIEDADEIKITLHNDKEFIATVVGHDARTDIAVLKFKTSEQLNLIQWGDSSKLRVGEWIIAIGNPFGLSSTVTVGIVSTIARNIPHIFQNGADYVDGYIQTDAPINMGNSGCPMFDINGKVQAVATSIFSPNGGNIGIGFGIPAEIARETVEQLIQHGRTKRGWIGVGIQAVSKEIAESLGLKSTIGALVGYVDEGGPGFKAGIKAQDIIIKFNNLEVTESRKLPHIVGKSPVNSTVTLVVLRGGKEIKLRIKIEEFEKAQNEGKIRNYNSKNNNKANKNSKNVILGMEVINLSALSSADKPKYAITKETQGLFIEGVINDSEASEKLVAGEIIKKVTAGNDSIEPKSSEDFKNFINKIKKAGKINKILLCITRLGNPRYVTLSIEDKK